jgi:hypothetical protein
MRCYRISSTNSLHIIQRFLHSTPDNNVCIFNRVMDHINVRGNIVKMDKLRSQARSFIFATIIMSSYINFFLLYHVDSFRKWADFGGLIGVTWTILPVLIIFTYEKVLWKCVNPHLDFEGHWSFSEEQYELLPNGEQKLDYTAWGGMKIRQNPYSIAIIEGQTHKGNQEQKENNEISTWWSESCDFDNRSNKIIATIGHKSAALRPGGNVQYGVEEITVVNRDKFGRPRELSSTIYHCVGQGKPRVVSCHYTRK